MKQISHLVDEKEILAQKIKLEGKQFFTNYELALINKLGGLSACVQIQRSTSGIDELAEKISAMAYDMMISNIIEYKLEKDINNNVKKLSEKVIKKI